MILTIDQSKIDKNKKYKDKFIVYSYDDGNKIKLPKNSTYRVLFRNKVGVLPIVDQFSGDTYLLNNTMYHYFGLNTVEFIDLKPTRETVLLVDVEVNVSIQNMNASKIGTSYIYDLNTIVDEVKRKAFESNKEIDRATNSFVNRLNINEKEINVRLNESTKKLEVIEEQVEISNESLTLIGNQLKVIDEFLVDVADKSQLVDDKYQQFDDNVTQVGQTIEDILGLADDVQQMGVELNKKANKTQEAWITPTLLNGFTGNVRYRKTQFGHLEIYGTIISVNPIATTRFDVFSLPLGYQPTRDVRFEAPEDAYYTFRNARMNYNTYGNMISVYAGQGGSRWDINVSIPIN